MSLLGNIKNTFVFKRFLASYLFVLIIPLAIGSIAFNRILSTIEEETMKTVLSMVEQTKNIIDKNLKEIDEMTMQIAMDPKLSALMNIERPKPGSSDIWKVVEASKRLEAYKNLNSFKKNFYVFIKKNEIVMSRSKVNIGFSFNYELYLNYGNMDYSHWYNMMLQQPHEKEFLQVLPVNIDGRNYSMITYIQSIPLGFYNQPEGAIIFLIDEKEIQKLLRDIIIRNNGWVYVEDRKGNIIIESDNSEKETQYISMDQSQTQGYFHKKILNEDMMVTYTTSSYNGWKYIAVIPSKAVLEKVMHVEKISFGFAAAILLIGVIISYILAHSNSKPVKDITILLKDFFKGEDCNKGSKNEYDFMLGSISQLINSNNSLKNAFQNQSAALKAMLLERLLTGELGDHKDIKTILSHAMVDIKGNGYTVIILSISRYSDIVNKEILTELDMIRTVIEELLSRNVKEDGFVHILGPDMIGLLMCFKDGKQEEWVDIIEGIIGKVYDDLYSYHKVRIFFGIGNIYNSLLDIHRSCEEARKAVIYCKEANSNMRRIWYNQIPKGNRIHYYPLELEIQLYNTARSGNREGVERIFGIIYNENYINGSLSKDMYRHLVYDLNSTFLKLVNELNILSHDFVSKIFNDLDYLNEKDIDECFDKIKKSFFMVCSVIEQNKKSHNTELLKQILEYVDSTYMRVDICAYHVARKFDLSESYFSQFFKEQTGETFSSYLERIRIKNACEILPRSGMNIKDVAEVVGYSNAQTFRRAFKRVTGILPNNYR